MKRVGFLFEKLCSFDNLLDAANKAMRGKKSKISVAAFHLNMEFELLEIRKALCSGIYQPCDYRCFHIYEPKQRYICSADFRDRVLHHAICNVLVPIFERMFISDSYACRKDKGAHKAVRRVQQFCRKSGYFLKADIKKFFESVDHEILKQLLRRKIKDDKFLHLMNIIIDHPVPGYMSGKGLPIGNLTSQWWADFYLDALDHHLKDELGVKFYSRYMDDFVVLSDDKAYLHELKADIRDFLDRKLLLKLKEGACFVAPIRQGIPFLGLRIFPNLIRLKHENYIRFIRNYRQKESLYLRGDTDEDEFIRSAVSMIGHLRHADTFRMRLKYFFNSG